MLSGKPDVSWVFDLYRLVQNICTLEDAATVQHKLLVRIVEGFGATSGSLALMNEAEDGLVIVAGYGLPDHLLGMPIKLEEGILGQVAQSGAPRLINGDLRKQDHNYHFNYERETPRPSSAICWPLRVDHKVIGALSISRHAGDPYTQLHLEHGEVLMNLISLVVQNLRLYQDQQQRIVHLSNMHEEMRLLRNASQQSEQRLHELLEDINAIVWDADVATGQYTFVNQQATRILGFPVHDWLHLPGFWEGQIHADDREQVKAVRQRALQSQQDLTCEYRFWAADGRIVWLRENVHAVLDGAGGHPHLRGFMQDITEHKRSENLLTRLGRIFDYTLTEVYVFDPETLRFQQVNQRALNNLGYTSDELMRRTPLDLKPRSKHLRSKFNKRNLKKIMLSLSTGREEQVIVETAHRRKDGSSYPVEIRFEYFAFEKPPVMVAIVQDITERQKAQHDLQQSHRALKEAYQHLEEVHQQLLQSEKMAAIGQLAAGVAHEINNPIGYVYSNLGSLENYFKDLFSVLAAYEAADDLLAAHPDALAQIQALKDKVDLNYLKDDILALVSESREGITRVKHIVQDLKDFSHVDEVAWQWADLHKGINSTLNIVNNEIKYKAEIIRDFGDIPWVECLPSQLNQVFMNMLVNAAHAIEGHGTIVIRTLPEGDKVCVEISDTGKGMTPECMKRIFDPFFTTKPVGQGTGLGLSLSYGIIKKHHGRIEVNSDVGVGTTFKIWIPVNQSNSQAA